MNDSPVKLTRAPIPPNGGGGPCQTPRSGVGRAHRGGREIADDGGPLADVPAGDEAARDIRVGAGEILRDPGVIAGEHQDRPVDRIGKRPADEQLAPFDCRPGVFKMRGAELRAAFENVVNFANGIPTNILNPAS